MLKNSPLSIPQLTTNFGKCLASRLAGTIALLMVFVIPALGQTDYSDSWLDDSDPNALFVVGVGVTDNDYSADAIAVETTLTSPNGRTVSGESDDYGSARIEVALPWDWDDLGDYFVRLNINHSVGATGTAA